MNQAFVLGNGKSRLVLDLPTLQTKGPIYGCNALYRTFYPDCLVSTDPGISRAIQESGYPKKHRHHTRRPVEGLGSRSLPKEFRGYSSGPNALAQALLDGYHTVYLIGMDLGTTDGQFNNIYGDTEFYKRNTDPPTFAGNWVKQIRQLCERFPDQQVVRVMGVESAHVPTFNEIYNMRIRTMEHFRESLNI